MSWAFLNREMRLAVTEFTQLKSDRIAAVLGAAVVEQALLQALSTRLRDSSVQETMFKPGGAFGDFFAKINLGYLLHMYESPAQSAMHGLAQIRNVFAHQLAVSSFKADLKPLNEGFDRLKLHTRYKKYPAPFWDGDTDNPVGECKDRREVFITNIKLLLFLLMRDLYVHLPHSNVAVALPKEFDNWPAPGSVDTCLS
jgi:hypothetical protein